MRELLKMLFFENGGLSLTRTIAAVFVLLFVFVTIYLVVFDMSWQHFETLATMAAGGGPATQVANKLINSTYNSAQGSYEQKRGVE